MRPGFQPIEIGGRINVDPSADDSCFVPWSYFGVVVAGFEFGTAVVGLVAPPPGLVAPVLGLVVPVPGVVLVPGFMVVEPGWLVVSPGLTPCWELPCGLLP